MTLITILIILILVMLFLINRSLNFLYNINCANKDEQEQKFETVNQKISERFLNLSEEFRLLNKQLNNIQYILEAGLKVKADDLVPELIEKKEEKSKKLEKISKMQEDLENLRQRLKFCGTKFPQYKALSEDQSLTDSHKRAMLKKVEDLVKESEKLQKEISKIERDIELERHAIN